MGPTLRFLAPLAVLYRLTIVLSRTRADCTVRAIISTSNVISKQKP